MNIFSRFYVSTASIVAALLVMPPSAALASNASAVNGNDFIKNQLIVQLDQAHAQAASEIFETTGVVTATPIGLSGNGTYLVTADPFASLSMNMHRLSQQAGVEFVEPNYRLQLDSTSDDTSYTSGDMWGLYGQSSTPSSSYGVNATGAWSKGYTGTRQIYVAIIDSGINYNHPDLAANIWTNAAEIPGDGIDNDGDGFVDDVHGYDFLNNDGSVYDEGEHIHGTHVAGTIGAVGGNGIGVTGVAWQVSLISAKISNSQGEASIASAIAAIDYVTMLRLKKGLDIIATNNSWGGTAYSRALENAIKRGGDVGIIFVAAAGNDSADIGSAPTYPAAYDCTTTHRPFDCVVSVAAINEQGGLAAYSNYSSTRVDLAAPGSNIISTVGSGYQVLSGTSMATPHVTGAIALCLSSYRGVTAEQAISKLKATTIPESSLAGKVATGGRLNVEAFVDSCAAETTALSGSITNTKLSALYTDRMRIDWDDTVVGDYEQEIQVSVGPDGCAGTFAHFGYIGPGLTSYPVFNLEEAQFYCFRVRGIRDSVTTSWNKSNVAITWTSNLPYISGKVTLADGVTPVAKMPVKWLATGAYAGLENSNALTAYTNVSGEYVLQVPNGVEGELFLNTSRYANKGLDTIPTTPWGLEAGGKVNINQDLVADIVLPAQKTVTVTVLDSATNQPVPGASIEFSGYSKSCKSGTYTPFTGAIEPRCLSWPGGYAHSAPVTNASGQVEIALLDSQYLTDPNYGFMVHDPNKASKITNFTLTPSGPSSVTVIMNPPVIISGRVLMSDGVTPVSGAPVKWLNDGQYAGLDNSNALVSTTNALGQYALEVPSDAYGKLFVNTSRYPDRTAKTNPQLPWGMEAGGFMTASANVTVDITMPKVNTLTFNVTNASTGTAVSNAPIEFSGYSKSCKNGSYSPFASASKVVCLTWPTGYAFASPRTNGSGQAAIAVFDSTYYASNTHTFLVRDPSDSTKTTAVEISPTVSQAINVALNPPVTITGKVLLSDGVTTVANAPVKWLNDGQYAGLDNANALSTLTNAQGEYSLQIPSDTLGKLFVNTSRYPDRTSPTTPIIPWGMEAGGNMTATQSKTVNIVLPKQNIVTMTVKEWASNIAVAGAKAEFSGYSKGCKTGAYSPFAGATSPVCVFWPTGYAFAGPVSNGQGLIQIAVFDQSLVKDNAYAFNVTHPIDAARVANITMSPTADLAVDVIMPGTPSQPEQPSATALTSEVRLGWSEPWDGGAFIDYYQVWSSLNADGPFTLVPSGTCAGNISPDLRACVVSGLTPGVTYYFAIIAHNVVGYSQLSMATSSTPKAAISTFTSSPTPSISGTASIGEFLIAKAGTWDSGTTLEYEWLRDGSAISGAIGSSYLLRAVDAGKAISVRVTGRKTGYQSVTRTSATTTPSWPVGAALVAITGTPVIGQMLIAEKSTLLEAKDIGYKWLRDGVAITGATTQTYEPTLDDVDAVLTVQLTGAVVDSVALASKTDAVTIVALASDLIAVVKGPLLGAITISPTASPEAKAAGAYTQKTLPVFANAKITYLSATQKAAIRKLITDTSPAKFICTGIRLKGATLAQNILVRKRAKASCDYAKSLDESISTWYQSKETTYKPFVGKILIGLRG